VFDVDRSEQGNILEKELIGIARANIHEIIGSQLQMITKPLIKLAYNSAHHYIKKMEL